MEAAFFDLDKTVIAKASMLAFGKPFYREGMISKATALRALYGQLIYLHLGADEQRLARIRESVLTLCRGWDQASVARIVAETLEEVVEPIIFAEAAELIVAHHEAGREVYIVSAAPEEVVLPLCRYLGADAAIASIPRIDDAGRYTGEMEFYAYGPYKAEAITSLAAERGIDLEGSYAYSDSYTDVPMLEVVGHAVAVNPDRVLLKLARDRGWDVRQFVRPVRLHPRLMSSLGDTVSGLSKSGLSKMARPGPARWQAAAAGAAVLGAGALILGLRHGSGGGPSTPGPELSWSEASWLPPLRLQGQRLRQARSASS
ncbi:MAG: HAD family hydrolase [Acidimicrobiales bacterium]